MNLPPGQSVAPVNPDDPSDRSVAAPATHAEATDTAAADERRRRLAEKIVADLLPETTGDERPRGQGSSGYSEQWYRENRPPHHGG